MWNLFLISLCTLYAVKTRNLPENFNEAKFIGFTMYCTLVVWIAFIVLHMGTVNKALTMSFSFSLSASIPLILLFFPKLYIIILHPEKNVRASYTTTKLIRCHFGNSQGAYDSKHLSSKTTRTSMQSGSDEKLCATAANLLLEEQEDEVGALLADSIENSVRTVLSTVAGGVRPTSAKPPAPKRMSLAPGYIESLASKPPGLPPLAPIPKPPRLRLHNKTPTIDEDGFEEVTKSAHKLPGFP
ncbi:hypothetical protein OESDEN_08774 [Oesophagostomum dentatum]|uniref:G-protein coupled receptors family 3 profile domain-containing protein n=1 Tax=Oesophagostomum dentatum TaxID=61180 RepID=A0A0B1T5E2_OESDE|nr:hypothetical protein OESDEN_08774 [Oesophagostomum dentatum]